MTLLYLVVAGTAYAEPCRSESFKGASYFVCSFDLTKDELRIYWRRSGGMPYRTFAALAADLERKVKSLHFAMNGGMYQDDFRPVGLYIENGQELTPANTATLTGGQRHIDSLDREISENRGHVSAESAEPLRPMFCIAPTRLVRSDVCIAALVKRDCLGSVEPCGPPLYFAMFDRVDALKAQMTATPRELARRG